MPIAEASTELLADESNTIRFDQLQCPVIKEPGDFETRGWIDLLGSLMIKPGDNMLTITDCPANLSSISIWMTEGAGTSESYTGGAIVSTQSVQINSSAKSIRVYYYMGGWKKPIKAAAQIILCLRNF